MSNQINRLYRSRTNRMIGGVCAGLGSFFGIDPTVVRIVFAVTAFYWPFILALYMVLLLVIPEEPLGQPEIVESQPSSDPAQQ